MLEMARKLCQGVTGSQCSVPTMSNWSLVAPSQSTVSVDVLDIATGGIAAAIPANVKVHGSYFETGLSYNRSPGGFSTCAKGYGVGAGAGIGWGIPFAGAKVTGKLPNELKKKVIESLGEAAQGKILDTLKDAVMKGPSGGTRLVAGPDASGGDLTTADFQNAWCTIIGVSANFAVNGVSFGVVIFSKIRPVIDKGDLMYARAIGLMGGAGLATNLDIEASGMVYRVSVS